MKSLLITLFILSLATLWGAILTVDNNSPSIGQYATLQAAHDAASDGDMIHVIPSNETYGSITITKRITIIGPGWIPEGCNNITIKGCKITGQVVFNPGSENSCLCGFGGPFELIVNAANVTVRRCKLSYLEFTDNCQNLLFYNNYYSNPRYIRSSEFSTYYFFNNIITNISEASYEQPYYNWGVYIGSYYHVPVFLSSNAQCVVSNNYFSIIGGDYKYYVSTGATPQTNNNLISGFLIPNSESCNYNMDVNDLYGTLNDDFTLSIGSPAIDAGNPDPFFNDLNGSRNDIGPFGGPSPFVIGGITGLPSITEIEGALFAPPNEPIQIQIKAKTNRD